MDQGDYDFGRQLYEEGKGIEHCLSEDQRDGWQDAAADSRDKGMADSYACMVEQEAAGEPVDWANYWKLMDRLSDKYANA
jgi:hypothetical protein